MQLFDAFKHYIIKHPKVASYKPSSDLYEEEKLIDIVNELESLNVDFSENERDKVIDFIRIATYLHKLYVDFYDKVQQHLVDFNMNGAEIVEFFIAFMNKEFKTVHEKMKASSKLIPEGTYLYQDMTNHKIEISDGTQLDLKAAMEAETDAISMLCNYMRYHLDDEYKNLDANPEEFTTNLLQLSQMADIMATFKHSYDHALYDKTFVKMDMNGQRIVFDYDNYHNEKLKALGHSIIGERILHVAYQNKESGKKSLIEHYVSNYRVKRVTVNDGFVTLDFGQGNPKHHLELVQATQAAVDAYYEFLDLDLKLEKLNNISVAEAIGVWVALQYVCHETMERMEYRNNVVLYTREDMSDIPRKFRTEDLLSYIVKLTGIKQKSVKTILNALEVDWKKYNDIWTSPIFKIKDYYCLPFYPIVNSMPYNIIEHLMSLGGYDIDKRGYDFEQYVYEKIAGVKHKYQLICNAAKHYGSKETGEQIDMLISLRDVVVVVEAKCIHYSMEPQNYGDAWNRIETGAEQALRKMEYVKAHPNLFVELGDVSKKRIIPVVLTNYPVYSGFEFKGVNVTDAHTFISYFNTGYITRREMSLGGNYIVDAKTFYRNETEFSNNFENYLKNDPVKSIHLPKMVIEDIPLLSRIEPWKCIAKTAVYKGDPRFNISNRP